MLYLRSKFKVAGKLSKERVHLYPTISKATQDESQESLEPLV